MSQPASFPPEGTKSPDASAASADASATGSTEVASAAGGKQAAKKPAKKKTVSGPRRVRLALTRVNPFSVMKVAFLLSVAMGIMVVVAAAFVWFMLDAMHVFSTIEDLVSTVMDTESNAFTALLEYMKFSRAISMATIIAVVNIILTTALATIGAFLYNITARLVGGIHLTLADE